MYDREDQSKLAPGFSQEIDAVQIQSLVDILNKHVPRPPPVPLEAPFYTRDRVFRVAILAESLGDAMHRLPLVERFYRTFAPMEIDLFARLKKFERIKLANGAFHFVRRVLDDRRLYELRMGGYYDLVIAMKAYPVKYWIQPRSLPRFIDEKPALLQVINEAEQRFKPFKFAAHHYPHMHGLQNKMIQDMGMNMLDACGYFANMDVDRTSVPSFCPDPEALAVLERLGLAGKRYITVHDGFDPDMADNGEIPKTRRMTRSWPLEHWGEFVRLFKAKYPDILVVQVGVSNSAGRIANVDMDLLDRTSLPESCWIIKNGLMLVDTETGMTPVAWATQVPAISMQGPTGPAYYSYPQTKTVLSDFCHGCTWVKPDWSVNCVRGFERAECMHAIKPQTVLEAAAEILAEIPAPRYELAECGDGSDAFPDHAARLDNLLRELGLEPDPASGRTYNKESGIHYSAAQRQPYLYVLSQVGKKVAKGRPLKIVVLEGGCSALAPCLALAGHDVTVVARDYLKGPDGGPSVEACFIAWAAGNKLDLRFGSVFNVPVASASADIVLCLTALEKLPHPQYALQDALRLLKPGGIMIMTLALTERGQATEDRGLTIADLRVIVRECGIAGDAFDAKIPPNTGLAALVIRRNS